MSHSDIYDLVCDMTQNLSYGVISSTVIYHFNFSVDAKVMTRPVWQLQNGYCVSWKSLTFLLICKMTNMRE